MRERTSVDAHRVGGVALRLKIKLQLEPTLVVLTKHRLQYACTFLLATYSHPKPRT